MRNYLFIFSIALGIAFSGSFVDAQSPNPQNGSIGLKGVVQGDAPTSTPTISFPADGSTADSPIQTVRGSCSSGLFVLFYRNDIFAGSTFCENSTYEANLGLSVGLNTIKARHADALGQQGPDSNTVSIEYRQALVSIGDAPLSQLFITSQFSSIGGDPSQALLFSIQINGGSIPFALSINWGDGSDDLVTVGKNGNFEILHTYQESGIYVVTYKATDETGAVAFFQQTAVVNGEAVGGIFDPNQVNEVGTIVRYRYILWPLYVLCATGVLLYFAGKRQQKRSDRKHVDKH